MCSSDLAGVTGAPPMNLVDCDVAGGRADVGGVALTLPANLAAAAGPCTLGLRPENLTLAPQSPADLALPATLSLLEPLGAETLITVRIGAAQMMARVGASFRQPSGAALTLHVDPRHLHLFNRQTGLTLS